MPVASGASVRRVRGVPRIADHAECGGHAHWVREVPRSPNRRRPADRVDSSQFSAMFGVRRRGDFERGDVSWSPRRLPTYAKG